MRRRRLPFPVKHYLEHILPGWSDACGRKKHLEGKEERKNECRWTGKNSNTEAGDRGDGHGDRRRGTGIKEGLGGSGRGGFAYGGGDSPGASVQGEPEACL